MRTRALCTAVLLSALALPASAAAEPPVNDNYLNSVPVNNPGTRLTRDVVRNNVDSTEATTQPDLFAPPASGGGAETTVCNGIPYGKTVWYDFHPELDGFVEIQPGTSFPTVLDLYEFGLKPTPAITRNVQCASGEDASDFTTRVRKGRHYTVQIGGVDQGMGPAGGLIQFKFMYFPDPDHDGVVEGIDQCPTQRGIAPPKGVGCPPTLKATPKLTAQPTPTGVIIRSLSVDATKGAKVTVRCKRKCSLTQVRTARVVSFSKLAGKALPSGAVLEIFVTKARSIGVYLRYDVVTGNLKRRADKCLKPGSMTPRPGTCHS